jgi:hypothetical protein
VSTYAELCEAIIDQLRNSPALANDDDLRPDTRVAIDDTVLHLAHFVCGVADRMGWIG